MFRFAHVNIIAQDSKKLIEFYKNALQCKSIGETRDIKGEWLNKMTGVANAHIVGEHLCMPGYEDNHPTLEIFSYNTMLPDRDLAINRCGLAHLAFEVEDVEETLKRVLAEGGGQLGELVRTEYDDGRKATFVYAKDIEDNILELQSWSR